MDAFEIFSLSIFSLSVVIVLIVGKLASPRGTGKYGLPYSVKHVSDEFNTKITPASYTFGIWGVIYSWECLWIVYAWSFVFFPGSQPSIPIYVYWLRLLVNVCNISWIYSWCNKHIIGACVILYGYVLFFYMSNFALLLHFHSIIDQIDTTQRILTYILPINGMFVHTTWVTIASQINLTAVLSYFTPVSKDNSATVGLTILLSIVLGYFTLEVTVAEQYLRNVFMVYPVLIWASIGVLVACKEGARNRIYTIIILALAVLFFVAKVYPRFIYSNLMMNEKEL